MKKSIYAVLLLLSVSVASAGEREERNVIQRHTAHLFVAGQFGELDAIARGYLYSEERTSSGLWKLSVFYSGINRLLHTNVTDEEYWENYENKALKWIEAYPNSPAGYLVYVHILIEHGWMYRGSGWGYQVKEENRKRFHDYIERAKEQLIKTKNISSVDPRWYELMLMIAKAQAWSMDEFNQLVDEATAKSPYFYQTYFEAIEYLAPRWHGSKDELEKFAQKVVNITRSREKNGMYARIYWAVSQDQYGPSLFRESSVVWANMSAAIDDVLEQYPDQWNINNFAYFACLAGDANKTYSLIKRIEGDPLISAWKSQRYFSDCKHWSAEKAGGGV